MEQSSLFRKASVERIQSPEQLNDYLRITNPTIWVLLAAVIVLLAGMLMELRRLYQQLCRRERHGGKRHDDGPFL